MNRSEYSYLDLTVMPFLRRKVISNDAAILFDGTITKVLWANAIGTDLFGGSGIYSLLNLELSEKHSLVRQLKNAAKQISDHEPVERSFRVARGFKSDLMQGELTKIELPNGETAVLLVFEAQAKTSKMREHELATLAVDALEDFADAAAIVDEYGLVLASSEGFDTLDIDPDTLETLIGVVAREDDRLVKRKIEIGSGHHAAAGLGRIRDTPGRFLIVIADANEPADAAGDMDAEDNPVEPAHMRGILLADNGDLANNVDQVDDTSDASENLPWLENANDQDEDLLTSEHDNVIEDIVETETSIPAESTEQSVDETLVNEAEPESPVEVGSDFDEDKTPHSRENGSLLDRWYFSDNPEKAKNETPRLPAEPSNKLLNDENLATPLSTAGDETDILVETFHPENELPVEALENDDTKTQFENAETAGENSNDPAGEPSHVARNETPNPQPRRFAFSIDSSQVVKSVSSELAACVGELSGDILGKHWKTISTQRGFDENSAILSLLEKADTWSGKSVLWPIDETDMVVPIDLAALPVFDRERNFDGFRGFGVIRMDDAIVDPNGYGLKLAQATDATEIIDDDAGIDTDLSNADDDDVTQKNYELPVGSVWGTNLDEEDAEQHFDTNEDGVDGDDFSRDVEGIDSSASSQKSGNVFQLSSKRKPTLQRIDTLEPYPFENDDDQLTGKEQKAFSEISRSLTEEITAKEDATAKDTSFDDDTLIAKTHNDSALPVSGELLETLPVPLFVYKSDETLFANDALLALTGYSSTEEIADAGGVDALLSDRNGINETNSKGLKLIRKDGKKIAVRSRLSSIAWEGDKALCLTFAELLQEEPTEKMALDLVRISELENILETAADGILVIDQDGKIESLNASGEALFGIEQKSVIGKSFGKLFATESRQALETYIRDLNAPGVSSVFNQGQQVIGVEAGGGLIPLFATIGRVGSADRYCAVLRDLTQWKKNEEELVEAKRNAETASEQKSEFLSRISHEIREPLTAIIGFSDVMIEERFGKIDNERYREYLRDINRSGIHVLDLVNDLLDISKIEAGKLELSYEAVDLNQLAAETVALLQPQANNKRILIRTSLSRAVPKVVADARSIRQIILNLVSNAINHSPKNSQVIVSTTFEENSEVGLRIRDTGEGMTQEELTRALQPFAQVGPNKNRNQTGSGLGLPLTKALVEANRAYFDLESTPGEGTIAHIQFPSQRVLAD